MLGRVLEPGQEVEGLAKVAAMMETARHRGQVLEARGDVARSLLEDLAPLVLGELPPRLGLPDRDECCPRCLSPTKRRLLGDEPLVLCASDVAFVAGHAPKRPRCGGQVAGLAFDDGQM